MFSSSLVCNLSLSCSRKRSMRVVSLSFDPGFLCFMPCSFLVVKEKRGKISLYVWVSCKDRTKKTKDRHSEEEGGKRQREIEREKRKTGSIPSPKNSCLFFLLIQLNSINRRGRKIVRHVVLSLTSFPLNYPTRPEKTDNRLILLHSREKKEATKISSRVTRIILPLTQMFIPTVCPGSVLFET